MSNHTLREKLLARIPEFDLIQDADLREKTIRAWETALQESEWTLEACEKMPFTLLVNPCPVSFIDHVRAVTLTALRCAEVFTQMYGDDLPVNQDFLIAAALLHDLGKLVEYTAREDGVVVQSETGRLLRHPFTGMELAARCGLPVEVQHIIVTHAGEGDQGHRSTEATILNHVDFMHFQSFLRMTQKKELAARMR